MAAGPLAYVSVERGGKNGYMRVARGGPGRPSHEELAGLSAALGSRVDLLAWARGSDILAVATRADLAVAQEGIWQIIPWDDILQGKWQEADGALQWVLLDGHRQEVRLADAGDLPGVFMERVQASIVVQERVPVLGGSGEILVSARRNPAGGGQLRWMVQPVGRISLQDPEVQRVALAETENLRREYGP